MKVSDLVDVLSKYQKINIIGNNWDSSPNFSGTVFQLTERRNYKNFFRDQKINDLFVNKDYNCLLIRYDDSNL